MIEQIRENYFLAVKTLLVLAGEICLLVIEFEQAGASGRMLLLLALFFGLFAGEELSKGRVKACFLAALIIAFSFLFLLYGEDFWLLGILLMYEVISFGKSLLEDRFSRHFSVLWYLFPMILVWEPKEGSLFFRITLILLVGIIYIQHDFVVTSYQKEVRENSLSEQQLKKNMHYRENALREEMNRGLLVAENEILEERARLSQTLHDKLGHNINGSIYQLEAVKLLVKKEPETSRNMVQAVIDQLRTGMDEIRSILRRERPEKYKLAVLQLRRLCEECRGMGIEAELITKGNLSDVPENYLEIILDNAVEAVSNALKYAHCSKIEIEIIVMNQMLRCSISDNGIGCSQMEEGMGIAGMRRRVRSVNGILDLATETGFTINMLLPMKE